MVEVLEVQLKTDTNGKKYKFLSLFSPEHSVKNITKWGIKESILPSKKCGYVAYEQNYSKEHRSDPWYNLNKGDIVTGKIVTRNIVPCMVGNDILTRCTVPVFCSEDDPIAFEIALERAFIRAGKKLAKEELKYGEIRQHMLDITPTYLKIPPTCLIVKQINY